MGIAAALATMGVAGAVGAGCSSSSTLTPGGGGDGGQTGDGATGNTGDGGTGTTGDGGTGTHPDGGSPEAGPTPVPANLVIAHTSPGVPPFRVCFATGSGSSFGVTAIQALPDSPGGSPAYPTTGSFAGVAEGTPGIYPGTIGAFPQITDLATIQITPFVVLSSSIANDVNIDGGTNGINATDGGVEEDCVQLIGTHGLGTAADPATGAKVGRLTAGTDFWQLAAIPASTLLDNKTYLLTMNGCLPGATAAAAAGLPESITCGADYNPDGGNVSIGITQLDNTTAPDGGSLGVQFAHRSTAIENTPITYNPSPGTSLPVHDPASAGVWPAFFQNETFTVPNPPVDAGDDGGDAAAIDAGTTTVTQLVPVFVDQAAGPLKYAGTGATPAAAATLPINISDPNTLFGVFVQPLDGGVANGNPWPGTPAAAGGAPGDVIALPLTDIFALSRWDVSVKSGGGATGFALGQSYTFVLVGDPAAQQIPNPDGGTGVNPAYDGRGVHILAFPNSFVSKVIGQ